MKTEEKSERVEIITDGELMGHVSLRYPIFPEEYKRLELFYRELASSYLHYAKKRLPKLCKRLGCQGGINAVLLCKVGCNDEKYICVHTESRIYRDNELLHSKCLSNVWRVPECTVTYKRKLGLRKSSIAYNGKELYLFDK